MLKAAELKLMDGTTFAEIELIPSDDGYIVLDGEEVIHIMLHSISLVRYKDPGTQHFVKGRALAMYYDDSDNVQKILEEFDFELEELARFINESLEPEQGEEQPQAKGDNPYE